MARILITGAGGPAGLALARQLTDHHTIGVDLADLRRTPAAELFDETHRCPAAADPALIPALTALVRRRRVDLVIPTVQDELPVMAASAALLGAPVVTSPAQGEMIAHDKLFTMAALEQVGVPIPHTLPADDLPARRSSVIPTGAVANSVAVRPDGLGVIAVEAPVKTDNGWVVFFDANADQAKPLGAVRVGALPDMITLTPDGKQILVANEAEPAENYSVDPEGSISVIKAPPQIKAGKQNQVKTAGFGAFEGKLPEGVRIFGPEGTDAQNLEPEYITVDAKSKKAYVTLQENNAVAVVNLDQARVERIFPLGVQDLATVATSRIPSSVASPSPPRPASAPTASVTRSCTPSAAARSRSSTRTATGCSTPARSSRRSPRRRSRSSSTPTTRRTPSTTAPTTRVPSPRASRSARSTVAPMRSSALSASAASSPMTSPIRRTPSS